MYNKVIGIGLPSSVGEAWGHQGPTWDRTSETTTMSSTLSVIIIFQEFLTYVTWPPATPPQNFDDIAGSSAPPPGNVS